MYVYLNDCFVKKEEAAIPIDDRGLLLGDGLFETMRSYSGRVLLIEQHYKRLIDSLAKLEFSHNIDFNHFKHIIQNLIEKNQLEKHDATIRFTLTRGSAPRGLLPPAESICLCMATIFRLTVQAVSPIKAIISTVRRNEYSPATYIKSTSYIDNILAKQEAVHKGAQEAILLNTQGYIDPSTLFRTKV